MSVLSLAGAAGIGLVWGWLLGSLEGRVHRPRQTIPLLGLASLAVASSVWSFTSWSGILCTGVAALLTFIVHAGWRRHLRRQHG